VEDLRDALAAFTLMGMHLALAISRHGILMARIAAATVSTAMGQSKVARHDSATLRESSMCHSRPQSGMAPPLRLATVPVIALAWSDARNTAALASSASVVRRLRCVMLSIRA
jgi:hypothetical protein